jgi:ankyrin repeat protein
MVGGDSALMELMLAVAVGDTATSVRLLADSPSLASAHLEEGASRQTADDYYLTEIDHYLYAGDTALHVAGAGYRSDLARALVSGGADVGAKNRRGAQPLHYAADGLPGSAGWNPDAQAATVAYLVVAGADPNVSDGRGVTPLHRAVRTRCVAAVSALLDNGADPRRPNRNGSTPMSLATQHTGRGGTGSPQAKTLQRQILLLLERHGA